MRKPSPPRLPAQPPRRRMIGHDPLPAPVGRAVSHTPLTILLQYLRAPPRRVSIERPRAFVIICSDGEDGLMVPWLVFDGPTPSSRRNKKEYTLSVLSDGRQTTRTATWTRYGGEIRCHVLRRRRLPLVVLSLVLCSCSRPPRAAPPPASPRVGRRARSRYD